MNMLKNKIPPPIVAVVFAILMWGISIFAPVVELNLVVRIAVISVLLASGAFFGISGAISFKRAVTTVNPLKPETASSLVSSGIYKFSRNPMYFGLALFLLAWAVFLSSVWVIVGLIGFVLYMNRFQIEPEERALLKLFGSEYADYQSKVRRWL